MNFLANTILQAVFKAGGIVISFIWNLNTNFWNVESRTWN